MKKKYFDMHLFECTIFRVDVFHILVCINTYGTQYPKDTMFGDSLYEEQK